MSDLDPNSDRVEVTRTRSVPGEITEVRRTTGRSNNTMLWAVALIGAVTIAAVAFVMVEQGNGVTAQQAATAADQGRAQSMTDVAVAAQQSALAIQRSADQSIAQSQQVGADRAASDRAAAEDAAARAARSADQANRDASAVRTAPAAGDGAPP